MQKGVQRRIVDVAHLALLAVGLECRQAMDEVHEVVRTLAFHGCRYPGEALQGLGR